jgi:hypothetical protein
VHDLAPDIFRQRLLLEGYYTVPVDRGTVEGFLTGIAGKLELRTYGAPIVHAPDGIGKPENQGFDAYIPLLARVSKCLRRWILRATTLAPGSLSIASSSFALCAASALERVTAVTPQRKSRAAMSHPELINIYSQ